MDLFQKKVGISWKDKKVYDETTKSWSEYTTTQHTKSWLKYTTPTNKSEKLIKQMQHKCEHVKLSWIQMILVIKSIAFCVNRNARPNNNQLITYYLPVCYLLRIQQYPVKTTYNKAFKKILWWRLLLISQ